MTDPAVVHGSLWRDAQEILARHTGSVDGETCVWCGRAWPCAPKRSADRAADASTRTWNEAWTARHDLNSLRTSPGWQLDYGRTSPRAGWQRSGSNRKAF